MQSSLDVYVPPGSGDWAAPTGPAGYEDFDPYDTYGSYEDEGDATGFGPVGHHQPTLADRFREAPNWFRLGAPILVALIVVVALAAWAGGGDDAPDGGVSIDTNGDVSLNDVIETAYAAGFPRDVSEARVGGLIKSACAQVGKENGAERVADQLQRFGFDGTDLSGATRGLRAAGEVYSAAKLAKDDPNFFRDVALLISGSGPRGTTTTVKPTTTTKGDSTSTTKKPTTTTTKKPTTTTTRKPAASTTTTTPPSSTTSTSTTAPPDSTTSSTPDTGG